MVDIAPFMLAVAAAITAIVGLLSWRSKVVVVNVDTLTEIQTQQTALADRLTATETSYDVERERRRALEEELHQNNMKCAERIQEIVAEHKAQVAIIAQGYEQKLSGLRVSLDQANKRIRALEAKNGD